MSRFSRKIVLFFPIMLMAAALSGCHECDEAKETRDIVVQIRSQLTNLQNDHSPLRVNYCKTLVGDDGHGGVSTDGEGGLNGQLQAKIGKLTDGLNDGKFSEYRGAAWNLQQSLTTLKTKIKTACDYVREGMQAHTTEITWNAREALGVIENQVRRPGTEFIHHACDNDERFALLDRLDDSRDPRSSTSSSSGRPDDTSTGSGSGAGDGSGSAAGSGSATI